MPPESKVLPPVIITRKLSGDKLTESERGIVLGELHSRTFELLREAVNAEKRTVEMSFASEVPVPRWWGIEVLSHDPAHVRLDRWKNNPPLLVGHDPNDQRGVITNGTLADDRTIRGTALISRSDKGEELMMDIVDGIRTKTSIGYAIHGMRELKPEEMSDNIKAMALKTKKAVYRVDDWEPLEGSSVSVPADDSVGVGRSLREFSIPAETPQGAGAEDENHNPPTITQGKGERTMPPEVITPAPLTAEERAALETARQDEIKATGLRFESRINGGKELMAKLVQDAIDLRINIEQFRYDVYARIYDNKPLETVPSSLDLSNKDVKRFSISRAIMSMVANSGIKAEFERECSDQIAKNLEKQFGREQPAKGMYLPYDIQARSVGSAIPKEVMENIQRQLNPFGVSMSRDLSVGTPTAGGNLVATNLLAGSFIELLRNKMVLAQAGMRILPGLVGNVAIPKQTAAGTAYWVTAEGNAPTESQQTFGQVTLSPKTVGAFTDFTRQLLLQSTPGIDGLVQTDLVTVVALAIDKAVLHGANANGEPCGIYQTSGIGAPSAANMGWGPAVDFETLIASANASIESSYFIMGAAARGILKKRLKAVNTGIFLVDANNELNGYPILVTNQASAGYIFFGDWSNMLLGEWGVEDITVDPYTASTTGTVRVVVLRSCDIGCRIAGAFAVAADLS